MHLVKKLVKVVLYFIVFLVFIYGLFSLLQSYKTTWWELTSKESSAIKEYRVEVGSDVAYCMRVPASEESYLSIIKKRNFVKFDQMNRGFARECNEVKWWDINDNILPEFYIASQKDTLELITRVNGVIYYSYEIW